jgi:hypothetical protein
VIILGMIGFLVVTAVIGFAITSAAFSQRHWKHVIADGDRGTLLAAVEEALETFRGLRPPRGIPPADWRALQSAAVVAADRDRCRVSVMVEPDVRVLGSSERREVGPAESVARRVAVRMAERLLYEIPLAHFEAVQVDAYTQYRSPDGTTETECLLTTTVSRDEAAETDWDEQEAAAILATWHTRERAPGAPLDPELRALITPGEFDDDRQEDSTP